MKFSKELTDLEKSKLEMDSLVLVVNRKNTYEPFIGRIGKNTSKLTCFGENIIYDTNIPEDFVGLCDKDTMVYSVITE